MCKCGEIDALAAISATYQRDYTRLIQPSQRGEQLPKHTVFLQGSEQGFFINMAEEVLRVDLTRPPQFKVIPPKFQDQPLPVSCIRQLSETGNANGCGW